MTTTPSALAQSLNVLSQRSDFVDVLLATLNINLDEKKCMELLDGIMKLSQEKFGQKVKVVLNDEDDERFGLSPDAKALLQKLGVEYDHHPDFVYRSNPNLVFVVEKLGVGALKIEEVVVYPGQTYNIVNRDPESYGEEYIIPVYGKYNQPAKLHPQAQAMFDDFTKEWQDTKAKSGRYVPGLVTPSPITLEVIQVRAGLYVDRVHNLAITQGGQPGQYICVGSYDRINDTIVPLTEEKRVVGLQMGLLCSLAN